MRYPKEYVEQLCYRVDIVKVVQCFMTLRTRGSTKDEHVALCPFHSEKTPSFVVHSEQQIYHCFGCGRHGGVIKFLREYRKISFPEAIHWLAKYSHFYLKQWQALEKRREQKK